MINFTLNEPHKIANICHKEAKYGMEILVLVDHIRDHPFLELLIAFHYSMERSKVEWITKSISECRFFFKAENFEFGKIWICILYLSFWSKNSMRKTKSSISSRPLSVWREKTVSFSPTIQGTWSNWICLLSRKSSYNSYFCWQLLTMALLFVRVT